ncbi:MAG: nucleoside 2-deoxyribosyltransferase [Alphaproteobacteria bacterium]
MHSNIHAYLAGPDVFFPNAIEIGQAKKDYLASLGIIGHFPFDNEIPPEAFNNPQLAAKTIADANEKMMDDCCKDGNIGIILVNMNPFHGPSMDCGTAFEAGYMSALSKYKGNVIIVGYSADERIFEERVIQDVYNGVGITQSNGMIYGPDGNMIEAFGGEDNLMITAAIERTGDRVCKTFEEAAELAQQLAQAKLLTLSAPPKLSIARNYNNSMG